MLKQEILFEESAVKKTLKQLKTKGYTWDSIEYTNRGRYAIVKGNPNIAILLKRNHFFNFGFKFRKEGEEGVGDSINTQHLREFTQKQVELIYTMFKNGKLYHIPLLEFLTKSHKWVQKEGTEVRSINIHHYQEV